MDQASYVKGWDAGSRVASEAAAVEIGGLRAALAFYADEMNYYARPSDPDANQVFGADDMIPAPIRRDQGEKARAALEQGGQEKP